jgi:hypothetical protein
MEDWMTGVYQRQDLVKDRQSYQKMEQGKGMIIKVICSHVKAG